MTVLFALALALLQDQGWLKKETLDQWVKEGVAAIEKETGRKFAKIPPILIAKTEQAAEALLQDFAEQPLMLKSMEALGGDPKEQLKKVCQAIAQMLLGKYCFTREELLILPENIAAHMKTLKIDESKREDLSRSILMHELVHAADFPAHKITEKVKAMKELDASLAAQAAFEGHADYVAEKTLKALGWDDARIKAIRIVRPTTDFISAQYKFLYEDGQAFVEELARRGGRALIEKALDKLPEKSAHLYDVNAYLAWLDGKEPEERPIDLKPAAELIRKKFGDDWQFQEVQVGPLQVRASVGEALEYGALKRFLQGLKSGTCFVASNGRGAVCSVALLRFSSGELATEFPKKVEDKSLDGKKKQSEAMGAKVEFPRRETGTKDDVPYFIAETSVSGGSQTAVYLRVVCRGPWVVELNYIAKTAADYREVFGNKDDKDPMEQPSHALALELLKIVRDAK